MGRYSIDYIASVITEDPDILIELDSSMDKPMDNEVAGDAASIDAAVPESEPLDQSVTEPEAGDDKPLTAVEVEKQAEEMAGVDPESEVADQIKAQEEAQRQMELERQKLLQPQMQELRNSMGALGTGITQGTAAAQTGGEAFSGLDDQMAKINAILGQLENQI